MRISDWSSDVCSSDLHGFATAVTLPTFTGNHDHGRFSTAVRKAFPDAGDGEVLKRVELANAMMFALRGVPAIYSGDEQGFVGDGNDRDAREDMFASKVDRKSTRLNSSH